MFFPNRIRIQLPTWSLDLYTSNIATILRDYSCFYFLTRQSSKYICSEIERWKKVYNHHCFSEKSQNHETLRIHLLPLTDLFNFKSDSLEIKIQYR